MEGPRRSHRQAGEQGNENGGCSLVRKNRNNLNEACVNPRGLLFQQVVGGA